MVTKSSVVPVDFVVQLLYKLLKFYGTPNISVQLSFSATY